MNLFLALEKLASAQSVGEASSTAEAQVGEGKGRQSRSADTVMPLTLRASSQSQREDWAEQVASMMLAMQVALSAGESAVLHRYDRR